MGPTFKYPVIDVFFDADDIPCVFSLDAMIVHDLPAELIYQKSWDIDKNLVMAFDDFIKLKNQYGK